MDGLSGLYATADAAVCCGSAVRLMYAPEIFDQDVLAPRATRLVAACLTAVAGADFLQLAYDVVKKASGNTG